MALTSKLFLTLLTFMLAFNALSARKILESDDSEAQSPVSDDAFVVLDPNDPKVVGLAKFAIDEHNKESKGDITFKSVFQAAYTHSDGGLVYGLIVEGSEDSSSDSKVYDVDLMVTSQGDEHLVAFRERRDD